MRYKTTLDFKRRNKLLKDIKELLYDGIWLIDLDRRAPNILLGSYDSIAEAHDKRDYIWHYGDMFGRYLWCVNSRNCAEIKKLLHAVDFSDEATIPNIELEIDTLPMEVIGVRFMNKTSTKLSRVKRKR